MKWRFVRAKYRDMGDWFFIPEGRNNNVGDWFFLRNLRDWFKGRL